MLFSKNSPLEGEGVQPLLTGGLLANKNYG